MTSPEALTAALTEKAVCDSVCTSDCHSSDCEHHGHLPYEPIYVVFDGPPGHTSGRFVDVETADGRGVKTNWSWHEHPTAPGLWRLGPIEP